MYNTEYKPEESTTLSNFISLGKESNISYNRYSLLQKIGDNTYIPIQNIIHDYEYELKSYMVEVELSNEEYLKYKFKPRLLAYDVYGDSELYFIILALNNIADIKEFDLKKLNMLMKNDLSIINKIYLAEYKYILENKG